MCDSGLGVEPSGRALPRPFHSGTVRKRGKRDSVDVIAAENWSSQARREMLLETEGNVLCEESGAVENFVIYRN